MHHISWSQFLLRNALQPLILCMIYKINRWCAQKQTPFFYYLLPKPTVWSPIVRIAHAWEIAHVARMLTSFILTIWRIILITSCEFVQHTARSESKLVLLFYLLWAILFRLQSSFGLQRVHMWHVTGRFLELEPSCESHHAWSTEDRYLLESKTNKTYK